MIYFETYALFQKVETYLFKIKVLHQVGHDEVTVLTKLSFAL